MKYLILVFAITLSRLVSYGQITMKTTLPLAIAPNTELVFEVKVSKGAIANFAKYQLDVPEGMLISEVDSKNGTFSFENNRAKIVWVNISSDPEFTISMKLKTAAFTGTASLNQRFYFLEDGTRKDIEAEPLVINFSEAAAKATTVSEDINKTKVEEPKTSEPAKPKETLLTSEAPLKIEKPITNIENKKAGELIQQALQLKKDAKAAFDIGQKEKKESELKIAQANEVIKNAESITDPVEKKATIDKANEMKLKAENNILVSNKILVLSKSLSDNANDIETLIKKQGAALFANQAKKANSTDKKSIAATMSQKDIGEFREQAAQLKSDSKEAAEIGQKEKAESEKRINEANDLLKNAEAITNEEQKRSELEKANALKQKAESDLANAENIISLSATLQNNALDIENLIEKFYAPDENATSLVQKSTPEKPILSAKSEKKNHAEKPRESEKVTVEKSVKVENGLIYKVQIGAFDQAPDKSVFKGIGKIMVVTEEEKIKVLVGSYKTKEDALKKRLEMIDKGFDAFVVAYQDGLRVK